MVKGDAKTCSLKVFSKKIYINLITGEQVEVFQDVVFQAKVCLNLTNNSSFRTRCKHIA